MSKLTTDRLTELMHEQLAEHDFGNQADVFIVAEDEVADMAAAIVNDLDDGGEGVQ
ncbi:MAG: hypothetical protein U0N15_03655 [Bifidobacterium choerinum]